MKKIIVVIAMLSILFMIPNTAFSEEMTDYGTIWKAWGSQGQHAYLWGFLDGSTTIILAAMDEMTSSRKQAEMSKNCGVILDNANKKTATLFDENKLIDVMTNLYKDPANSYIMPGDMVYIARDSLKGDDITNALLKVRKRATETYGINKKIKRNN